jgi:D-alanyl-lipoteichoic acid acyltransferase DltB (MBOAT superfamily)
MLWGFFKKTVIADRIIVLVHHMNNNVDSYQGITLVIILMLQVIHVYADFSGYTDIVLGIAKMFRIELTNNFNRPLFAENVSMFWRRWHISLTRWCNDYIFNRILLKRLKWKKWAAVYGIFITFLVIGIWHGDKWTYIVLGILQGVAINYEFFSKPYRLKVASRFPKKTVVFFSRIITFLFVCVTIMLFSGNSMSDVFQIIENVFSNKTDQAYNLTSIISIKEILIITVGTLAILFVDYTHEKKIVLREKYLSNRFLRVIVIYAMIFTILFLGKLESTVFVYFNF